MKGSKYRNVSNIMTEMTLDNFLIHFIHWSTMNTWQASSLVYQMPYLADVKLFFITMSNFYSLHFTDMLWFVFVGILSSNEQLHVGFTTDVSFRVFIWLQDISISNYSTECFVMFQIIPRRQCPHPAEVSR